MFGFGRYFRVIWRFEVGHKGFDAKFLALTNIVEQLCVWVCVHIPGSRIISAAGSFVEEL